MPATEKILITGGSGFIGSEVVQIALARGFAVRNLDLRPPRDPLRLELWRRVDIRDPGAVEQEIVGFAPDRILHLASDTDVTIKSLNRFETTIAGTRNILSTANLLPGLKRLVHTSTQFVVAPGVEAEGERFYQPYTLYGEAKAEAEKLMWSSNLSVPWFIVRPTIIWGPHHPTFAEQIFKHIASRRYLHPHASEPIRRTFGYVTNVAQQMMAFATIDAREARRRVYYLGDATIDYDDWADAFAIGLTAKRARRIPVQLLRLLGRAGDIAKAAGIPSPIDSGRAFRMSTSSKIDLEETHLLTGPPTVSFETGVTETLAWLKQTGTRR